MVVFIQKILLIMWKNWILRKRHYVMTTLELLLPTLLSAILVVMRIQGGSMFSVSYVNATLSRDPESILDYPIQSCSSYNNTLPEFRTNRTILFTPGTNGNYTRNLMNCLQQYFLSGNRPKNVNIRAVDNGKDMEKIVLDAFAENNADDLWGGIDFSKSELPDKLHYRIRKLSSYSRWSTELLSPPVESEDRYGDQTGTYDAYGEPGSYLAVQHLIAMFHIEASTGIEIDKYQVTKQRFPSPPHYEDRGFSILMSNILPLFITLSYIFIAPTLIKRIVCEKELGIKELMKMMGLHAWIQWVGWFLSSFIMMTISAVVIVFLLCVKFTENSTAIFPYSAPELIFFTLVIYVAASIAFCFFISSFFSKPSLATGVGCIIWIISFAGPHYPMLNNYPTMNLSEKLSLCLLPNMALSLAIRVISGFEGKTKGMRWDVLASSSNTLDNLTLLHTWGMMVVDMVIYFTLTWYMDHVFPGVYGIKKPWYFPFTKTFWLGESNKHIEVESNHIENPKNFEKDPELEPTVMIQNLFKAYETGHLAVNNVSLNMYQGQITALLGHNGAGKTTTMSILTGMIPPTKGTAYIEGNDITTDTEKARQSVGLCPQHNMLFDILTVEEHLVFFAKLKGMRGKSLQQEVESLCQKLQLGDKRNTFAQSLSGGMKRKLNLGMALVGGTKVVMLDEPTSGLDPEARRAIWDLLQEFRKERCILLTTHFMEEADVLGDRIAIMAHGTIQCCGTTMFLKKRFGAGYHLTVSKNQNCDISKLTNIVQHQLPQAYVENHISNEISFTLMANDTEKFPGLFQHLEANLESLGINGFGLSVTTMEEVFLKVGEMAEEVGERSDDDSYRENKLTITRSEYEISTLQYNSGFQLFLQQFWGLLLKRWHYGRRRWSLIVAQVIIPALFVLTILLIGNSLKSTIPMEPLRVMDISQYGSNVVLYKDDNELLRKAYTKVFPPSSTLKPVDDIPKAIIDVGTRNLAEYFDQYVVGAELGNTTVNSMYNGFYYHSLPLSVNLVHNAILKQSNADGSIVTENAPLPENPDRVDYMQNMKQTMLATLMGVFIPVGMSIMAASFVIFPIHERVSKAKHIQLMTGVGGLSFWGTSFLWDFGVHIVACCVMIIIFATADTTNIVTANGEYGAVFFLILLYGWAAIPFSYAVSFISNVPSSGFNKLTIINLIAGLVFGFLIFFFNMTQMSSLQNAANILRWFARLLPIYPITIGFMYIPFVVTTKLACDDSTDEECRQAAQLAEMICGTSEDLGPTDYFKWTCPGIGQEYVALFFDGILYFVIIFLIERGLLYRLWYLISPSLKQKKVGPNNMPEMELAGRNDDSDVLAENERVSQIAISGQLGGDALLVHQMSKHFGSFAAVDNLSFGVKFSECFGLLGINGAGKTTTFRMLTGDETVTDGNAYIQHNKNSIALKENRSKFLEQISYCPQFDALIEFLTGRETLYLFARLLGIQASQIKFEVDKTIDTFDLTEHADKITKVYSGGNKRKLSAAIAFMGNRPLVFLDEPTTGVDPVARRKLWNILLAARNAGKSIILTSHSMEECEVLCSRVAIMVNGKFQCMGGIQHLKSKFNEGFTIMAKLKPSDNQSEAQINLQNYIQSKFRNCVLKDVHQGVVHYQVLDTSSSWTNLFQVMENAKKQFDLEDYSVSQATLEQVFLSFARKQRLTDDTDPKNK